MSYNDDDERKSYDDDYDDDKRGGETNDSWLEWIDDNEDKRVTVG